MHCTRIKLFLRNTCERKKLKMSESTYASWALLPEDTFRWRLYTRIKTHFVQSIICPFFSLYLIRRKYRKGGKVSLHGKTACTFIARDIRIHNITITALVHIMLIPFLVPLMIISCEIRAILCTRERARREEIRVVIQHARPPCFYIYMIHLIRTHLAGAIEKSRINHARS